MAIVPLIVTLVIVLLLFWAVRALLSAFGIGEPISTVIYVLMVVLTILWLLGAVGGHSSLKLTAASAVTIDVQPRVALAPATLEAKVIVTPNPENRNLRITIRGSESGYERNSDTPLDGQTPNPRWVVWKDVPADHYTATAVVLSSKGMVSLATLSPILVTE